MPQDHHSKERTLVIVKPDGVQRSLVGEIIKRFENSGLKIVGMKMLVPAPEHIEKHYTLDPNWHKVTGEKTIKGYQSKGMTPPSQDPLEISTKILANLKKYLSSGPVVAFVLQGAHAVQIVRKLGGGTEPLTSDVGTIRGDFVLDSYEMADDDNRAVRNLIHMSGSEAEANAEITHWFKPEELINYRVIHEEVLYDVNLDGILE
jgi:nucleoside-diphosphate kinase